MKQTLSKLFEKLKGMCSVFMAHKTIAISTAIVIVVMAVAIPLGVHHKNNIPIQNETQSNNSSEPVSSGTENVTKGDFENKSEDITSDVKEEAALKEETTATESSEPTKVPNSSITSSVTNEPSSSSPSSDSTPPPSSSSGSTQPAVVQMANPDTGVSWDGKSPIVYTYPDGTTGTEKRDGATYEQVPGMINTIIEFTPVEYDGKCSSCGKTEGNGAHGTCLRFWTSGHDCPNCDVFVPARTCHTCSE